MFGPFLEFADLQRISGYERVADVERWAERNGIQLKRSRSGVWTTVPAVNHALGVPIAANLDDAYPVDTL